MERDIMTSSLGFFGEGWSKDPIITRKDLYYQPLDNDGLFSEVLYHRISLLSVIECQRYPVLEPFPRRPSKTEPQNSSTSVCHQPYYPQHSVEEKYSRVPERCTKRDTEANPKKYRTTGVPPPWRMHRRVMKWTPHKIERSKMLDRFYSIVAKTTGECKFLYP